MPDSDATHGAGGGQRHPGLRKLVGGLGLHIDALLQAWNMWRTRRPLRRMKDAAAAIATASGTRTVGLMVIAPGVEPSATLGHGRELGRIARVLVVGG
jgi:hypothetical protein